MAEQTSTDLLLSSLVILFVILVVLLILCWVLRKSRNRNLTELRISAKQPPLRLVIRTKPDHAQELLDHLLLTVFLRQDDGANPEGEPAEEQGEEREPEPTASSAASRPNKALDTFYKKLTQWITVAVPAKPEIKINSNAEGPHPSPADQDQEDDLPPQCSDESQHAVSSRQAVSSSGCCEEDKIHEETQL